MSLLGVLSLTATLWAAGPGSAEELERLDLRLGDLEGAVQEIAEDLTSRRGLVGNREAQERYEDAVYAYLVGDYDRAAREFFTLVESGSLRDPRLTADASWYLAECLFEMGNLVLAEEVYGALIDAGPGHIFFSDAVRRQLELYSLVDKTDAFYALYNTWVLTERVQANDSIRYTLAKSFYLQGDHARAKSLFTEVEPSSPFYARSRYFYGTVLVVEGSYEDAISEFQKASEISITNAEERSVVDLAELALGRLYYETGDLAQSSTYYQRIGRDSAYFDDALYEVVWTFIKQEDYQSALEAVEIFLLAYSEHRYTAQLKLVRGHLHRKLEEYEAALNRYEAIVEEYTPIQQTISDMAQERDEVDWFARLEQIEAGSFNSGEIPRYAIELLVSKEDVGRSVGVYHDLEAQIADLQEAQVLVLEIEEALALSQGSLGSFEPDRRELRRATNESLWVKQDLLENEEAWLLANLPQEYRREVRSLQERREDLRDGVFVEQDREATKGDRLQVYEAQVLAVQQRAARVEQMVHDLQAQALGVIEFVDSGESPLSEVEILQVKTEARTLIEQLDVIAADLEAIQASSTRRNIMFPLEHQLSNQEAKDQSGVLAEFDGLRKRYGAYRQKVDGSEDDTLRRIDEMWGRVDELDGLIGHATMAMAALERKELSTVKKRLASEASEVELLAVGLEGSLKDARVLGSEITQAGFSWLAGVFGDSVMGADMGIVDVYWVRKSTVTEERINIIAERQELLLELTENFTRIRKGLEE